ncbi:metallophosphoesterase [Halobellus sp. Atlit-31R]|nr:metallophosphoesterase [Halobellus sp. Atlit-31R]
MARLLLLGDLHLSTTGPAVPPGCPDLDAVEVDAIVSIGDVVDDNAEHAGDPAVGEAYEERGRAFFERLNAVGVPVVAVPGNHDPAACTRRLTEGLENVAVAHGRTIDGTSSPEPALDGLRFVGWGCEQFDLTPAFEYDRYPGIVDTDAARESPAQRATRSAGLVESTVARFLDGDLTASEAAAELGVAPDRRAACASELDALAAEFASLTGLLCGDADGDAESGSESDGRPDAATTVLLAHESPFHVAFDHHHSEDGADARLHKGSIPLKLAVAAAGPEVVFGGHTHVRGRDVVETTAGYADLYNPGSPGVAFVEIDPDTGSLQVP